MARGSGGRAPGQCHGERALERPDVRGWLHRDLQPLPGHQAEAHRTDDGWQVSARVHVLVHEQFHATCSGLHRTRTTDSG